jgi:hypothetical protein
MWVNKLKTNPLPVRDNTVQRVISLKCTVKQIHGGPEQRQLEIHVARNVTFYRPKEDSERTKFPPALRHSCFRRGQCLHIRSGMANSGHWVRSKSNFFGAKLTPRASPRY